ncbi:MAG: response regulator, partial [Lachnospiraceae bacterium]|nr:response regulator [Lachnospiraceae bacterium]
MRIAICDDEKIFLDSLEEKIYGILSKLDCEVIPFFSAEALLSSSMDYDLIFLDIEMGELDGMGAAKKIRETDFETPIVFLTSHIEMA